MFDISKVKTPCYVVDEAKLLKNLIILDNVMEKTGCKILLAQKAFSMYSTYPLIGSYLSGMRQSLAGKSLTEKFMFILLHTQKRT